MSSDRQQAKSGLAVTTLLIASASSLAAAVVVSRIWGPGTLIGAGATPVIVALVSEALKKPAQAIGTVKVPRVARYDPVAEGRRGLREGDLDVARPVGARASAERTVHRSGGGFSLRLPRPRLTAAIATGLLAFAVAAVALTSSELVLGKSVVSPSKRTTYIPVTRSTPDAKTTTGEDKQDTTTTGTTTTTAPEATTPTTTAPTDTTQTVPPAQTTPPAGSVAPTTSTPAPAPAAPPPGSTPPATTP